MKKKCIYKLLGYNTFMKRKSNKSGFSLIEVMVAMLVFLILVLGSSALVYQSGGGIQKQQNKREAIVKADHILEGYFNIVYNSLLSDYENSVVTSTETVNGRTMNTTVTFGSEQSVNGENYIQITVQISHGSGETVELTGRRFQFGLSKAAI